MDGLITCIGFVLCWLGSRGDASYDRTVAAVCGILGVCLILFDAGFMKLGVFLSSGLFSVESCVQAAVIDCIVGVVLLYSAGCAVSRLRITANPATREKAQERPKSSESEASTPKATAPRRRASPRRTTKCGRAK